MSNENQAIPSIIEIGGERWRVLEAKSEHDARCAIASAKAKGCSSYRLLSSGISDGNGPSIRAEVALVVLDPNKQFCCTHEAWYSLDPQVQEAFSEMHNKAVPKMAEIMFGFYAGDNAGEMAMRWYQVGGELSARIEIFHDSWKILEDLEIIDILQNTDNPSPEEFKTILLNRGFVDTTPRTR